MSIVKLSGGAAAAVTTAGVGSFVGGAMGTVAGAGIAAVITTVGDAVYQRSIERTRDTVRRRLRSRRPGDTPERGEPQAGDRTMVASAVAAGDGAGERTRSTPANDRTRVTGVPDDTPTIVIGSEDATRVDPAGSGDDRTRVVGPGTRVMASSEDDETALVGAPGGPDDPDDDQGPRRPPWRRYALLAATALLIFLVAMLAITGIERIKGSPLSGGESGTSVGSVLGTAPETSTTPSAPETTSSAPEGGTEETSAPDTTTSGADETSEPESTTTTSRAPQLVPTGSLPGNN